MVRITRLRLVLSVWFAPWRARHGLMGLSPQNVVKSFTVKHTVQEPGGELCDVIKFYSQNL